MALIMAVIGACTALWTKHGITEVEAIIASQATLLSNGGGLYYDLNAYPFTVSPYGPLLYGLEAVSVLAGFAPMTVGRLISILALCGVIFLVHRLLREHLNDRYAIWTGTLCAGASANLITWGSVGQSDMLALFFSVAALERYSAYRSNAAYTALVWSAVCIAAAIFSKQSFVAAGATISILHLLHEGRRGLRFVVGLGAAGIAIAFALNWGTAGGYWQNAVIANLNPYSWGTLADQLNYLVPTAAGLVLMAAAGFVRSKLSGIHMFGLYLALALAVFFAISPKVGSDLNYQIETVVALCLCAAWSLDRLNFFRLVFAGDRSWITLLQLPLMLYIVLNIAVTAKVALGRMVRDLDRQEQFQAITPYLHDPGRLVSVEIDPLLQVGRSIEVEPLIFTFVEEAGMLDGTPVLKDLREKRFSVIILYEDLFKKDRTKLKLGTPTLPDAHLEVIKEGYALVDFAPGPLVGGLYIYKPRVEQASFSRLDSTPQVIP